MCERERNFGPWRFWNVPWSFLSLTKTTYGHANVHGNGEQLQRYSKAMERIIEKGSHVHAFKKRFKRNYFLLSCVILKKKKNRENVFTRVIWNNSCFWYRFYSEISPWAYARIKLFFILWTEIKNSFLVRIKICKNFIAQNLMPNLLVIILRSLLF